MRKILSKVIIVIMFFISCNIAKSWSEEMGTLIGSCRDVFFSSDGTAYTIHSIFFQFGVITKISRGGGIIIYEYDYLYGEEDLHYFTKSNFEENNEIPLKSQNVYALIFEANRFTKSQPRKIKIDIQDMGNVQKLNLEKGKLYFIVYLDSLGKLLGNKKIIIE